MPTAAHLDLIVSDDDMTEPRLLQFAGGHVAVFSSRAPDKEGPNEDTAGVLALDAGAGVLVVADGMGGQPGGETAASIALRCLRASLESTDNNRSVRSAILDALEHANYEVIALGVGAATTFAALEVNADGLRPYHVGDSGILVVGQRGKMKLQTVAHSPVGYAVEAGLLDEHEAMHHDERHIVSNIVGSADMRIEVGSPMRLAPRDTALIASDGVFDNLQPAEVADLVRVGPLDRAASGLAARCSQRMLSPRAGHPSKPDDLTFVLYRPT